MKPVVPKPQRCAIYTRKSTEHNLDLEFNSLDAQREACEAYIKSQEHEGWRLVPDRYNDGGLSGASLDRPALQQLLADVRAGKITIVVVYKVDRLTRSLADFAKLVELFDEFRVSFVSITQSFNTTSSMGRLTLNVLLSFAQFEREVIGERVRDKIAASKRKGLWVGGPVPLGYRCLDKKLEIVPDEAEAVRTIFTRYLELGSMGALVAELDRRGIKTKASARRGGQKSGGIRFGVGSLAYLLKNRFYIGEITYRGEVHRGEHEPIREASGLHVVEPAHRPRHHHAAQPLAGFDKPTIESADASGLELAVLGHLLTAGGGIDLLPDDLGRHAHRLLVHSQVFLTQRLHRRSSLSGRQRIQRPRIR